MRKVWDIGGVVSLSWGFLLLLGWLFYVDVQNIMPWALLACCCHELGHYLAVLLCGGKVKGISLSVVGAEMNLPSTFSYGQELYCVLAGPLVNLLLSFWYCYSFPLFAGLNFALALLNLLPLSRLDGGRALYCFLALCCPYGWNDQVAVVCDVICSAFVLVLGAVVLCQGGSITLLILGLWLVQAME